MIHEPYCIGCSNWRPTCSVVRPRQCDTPRSSWNIYRAEAHDFVQSCFSRECRNGTHLECLTGLSSDRVIEAVRARLTAKSSYQLL